MSDSVLSKIGNTPMIEIKRLNPNPNVKMLAKLEYMNPGGSVKDRPALTMIESGERSGELTSDKIVIEATSGNTGIGLAMVCSVKKYRLLLVMSESASLERRKILSARGAELLLTPGHLGTDGAIEEVYRLVRENPDKYFMTDQFNNPENWKAHYETTGPEIWEQTNGNISKLIATMGTSGTVMGLSRFLKEKNSDIEIIGVEPFLNHKIQGLKNMKESYQPEIYEKNHLDIKINIEDEKAFDMTRQLAIEEGLFVGMSSGAAMAIAIQESAKMKQGTIVMIFPDSGERYLSTSLFDIQSKKSICFHNTQGNKKQSFSPLVSGKVSMYCCGPTASDRISLSECRRFVFYDLLRRYFEFRGHEVTQVMNITDLDDRTIKGAMEEKQDLPTFTQKHIDAFMHDMETLGIQKATEYPQASKDIRDMIEWGEKLQDKGYAYEKLRSLYFDISKFQNYGRYSGINWTNIRPGSTIDTDDYEKENPKDFTLFKRCRLSELKQGIYFKTRWGNVRPGWHTECAVMANKYLGSVFDIYAGSSHLIFPHQENMIAMSQALNGKVPARFWLNCADVSFSLKKLPENEESLGLQDLLDQGYSGRLIRFWLLSRNYRKPIKFKESDLQHARNSLNRFDNCLIALQGISNNAKPFKELDSFIDQVIKDFTQAMDDDLNISSALVVLYTAIRQIHLKINKAIISTEDAQKLMNMFETFNIVLNIITPESSQPDDPEITQLINERYDCRKKGDFERADQIRKILNDRGIQVRDERIIT
ncbi:cysteinyl-tRNA synthetase [Candidatus Magnetomorum sp. HK-1]|nr:cysteinyl-tRNA synthetase [Candidatus Magnetomorum sp. HK-1]